jgi:tryptophan synthase alpha subunit
MGLFIKDAYTLDNGISLSNPYIMIDNITIQKSNIPDFKYSVTADETCYTTKDVRQQRPDNYVKKKGVVVSINNVDNLHEQIYDEVKKSYENYTDDL